MKHDLNVVLNSRNKVTDSTPLHIATEGGHFDVVKKLLDAGASAADENKAGKNFLSLVTIVFLTNLLYTS